MTQGREFLELLKKICWVDGGPTDTYRRITFVFTPRVQQVKVYRIEQVPGYQELPVTEELCKSLTTWMKQYQYTEGFSYLSGSPESFELEPLPNGYRAVFTNHVDVSPFYELTAHDEMQIRLEVEGWKQAQQN